MSTSNINPNSKYVISGCHTGFYHQLYIDKHGFNVLAGIYYIPDNVASLKEKLLPKATVFRLSITKF
ncbi:unnamed protein product [Rotaria sp. Silwood2]|nr:unnamed protein product [Rotaria sp. Silwood2]CAF3151902.1 unnamed protein product [Rotaria sp. Silwood2]CAF3454155.1 unnamed protein product [Rotaria sp. Silwood2]CAF3999107.1 unnamed protein product [Rotaria sp. Silwood2]CAF4472708.1 unnamed protein product [Rotaria sp. Silwood2]